MNDPYKRIASVYDRAVEPFNKGIRRYAFKIANAVKGSRVLEIGCGTGANLELYQNYGCRVYGVDLSPAMLKIAADKLGDSAFLLNADASAMDMYGDGSFDLVMAMLTLHEMPAVIRPKVIKEMIRVMKDEGHILLIDYHAGSLRLPMGIVYKIIILFFEIAAGKEHYSNYRNFIKNGALPSLLENTELQVEKKKIIAKGNIVIYLLRKNIT